MHRLKLLAIGLVAATLLGGCGSGEKGESVVPDKPVVEKPGAPPPTKGGAAGGASPSMPPPSSAPDPTK